MDCEYIVTIPKTITIDPATKTATYEVSVTGDIGGTDVVNVTPESSFLMSSDDRADVTATVTQDKTQWTNNDFDTNGNGSISALDLLPGEWTGSLNFEISLTNTN